MGQFRAIIILIFHPRKGENNTLDELLQEILNLEKKFGEKWKSSEKFFEFWLVFVRMNS